MKFLLPQIESRGTNGYMKEPKKAVIRARCPEALKDAVQEAARIQQLDPSDIVRIACSAYVEKIRSTFRPDSQVLVQ